MKKKLTTAGLVIGLAASLTGPATQAADKQEVCSYYGNVGAAAIDFLMPLTFAEVVEMVSGKNKDLLERMSKAVERKGSADVKKAIRSMGDGSLELMGEAAGLHGFQLVMTGQATDGQEVFGMLASRCMEAGPDAIIEAQRRARALQAPDNN
ncbi:MULTISPECIES: hypothetical protein [Kordiimonas]|uniref:hypothetical protein n=1 Tax=Kordiimonas TaxID=288021 RepID=UPI00111460A0|nr:MULTISPECIES: hypothetical protein [Kordiimonas]